MGNLDKSADRSRIVPVNWGERSLGNWVARSFKYSDFAATGGTVDVIDIPANSFVAECYYVPKVVFNGTSPELLVGDETSAYYVATTEMDADSVILAADMMAPDATPAYVLKTARPFYASADHIRVTFTYSGTPTTGEGCIIACIVTVPSY